MALKFDGTGYVWNWLWEPASPAEFTIVCEFKPAPSDLFIAFSNSNSRALRVYPADWGSPTQAGKVRFSYLVADFTIEEVYLTPTTDLYDGSSHEIRVEVSSASVSLYVDGLGTPEDTQERTATTTAFSLGHMGRLVDDRAPSGSIISRAEFIDPNTPSNANDSIYLFNETSGTIAVDTGPRAVNGELSGFVDPDAAWVSASTPAIPGIPGNTLEYQGSPVTATTATISVHAGTDLKTTADYRIAGVALTNGAFGPIDLSGTSIAVGDPIVVEALPSEGPGIILRTTAGDIA
ncbi:MAG: hypothetical protein CL583_01780 [Alteromonadaceae bacterium]|nr:hypothetical protein [Alteromonadaceae bacterium]|tara:strand:+ start:965 stop:1840 length:876 start_codon:yes stop_codon:yes gene_type:complete